MTTLTHNKTNSLEIALWVLTVMLAGLYLMTGFGKVTGDPMAVQGFAHWGYPDWFRVLIGTLELSGAAGLLIPRLSGTAALGLAGIMAGAFFTHLMAAEFTMAPIPAVLLALELYLAHHRGTLLPIPYFKGQ